MFSYNIKLRKGGIPLVILLEILGRELRFWVYQKMISHNYIPNTLEVRGRMIINSGLAWITGKSEENLGNLGQTYLNVKLNKKGRRYSSLVV